MRRLTGALVVFLAVIGGLAWGAAAIWRSYDSSTADGCDFGTFSTDTGQASIAAGMVAVVTRRALPERAAVLVIAAGLQESKLRNIAAGNGDRDSVGVLQQRPSQGWGTTAQLGDISYATGAFLDRLVKEDDWQTLPLAQAIQAVQISADEQAYAKHEARAQAIADALTGATARGISCRFATPTVVAGAAAVARSLQAALPVKAPAVKGRQITVTGASWPTVAWFIANGDRLGVESVQYGGGRWKRSDGWKDDPAAGTAAVVATMHG